MAQLNADTLALQLEKVRDKLPLLYEVEDVFFSKVQKKEVMKVSSRNARIPLQVKPGGAMRFVSFDAGDMGRGSGTQYNFAEITPLGLAFAVEISKQVEFSTDSDEKAIENAAQKEVTNAMKQFRRDLNAQLQTAGDGIIGTIAAGGVSGNTLTLNNTPFGARLVRENMPIQIYPTAMSSSRGECNVTSRVQGLGLSQVITVDSAPGGTIAGDNIVTAGLSGANPVGLYGIPYHHNTATTGSWMGIARTNPYVVANGVNAASAAVSLPPFRLAINQIKNRLGLSMVGNMVWHMNLATAAGHEELGIAISEIRKDATSDLDLLFKKQVIGGYDIMEDIHADPTRADLVNFDTWGRVEWIPIDYFRIGNATVFPIYGTSGGLNSSYIFYLVTGVQYFVDNPAAIGGVSSFSLPSGY